MSSPRPKYQCLPEVDLDQQRDVAEELDVRVGDLADDPVLRESSDADDRSQEGRRHDAEKRDPQHVDHADRERLDPGAGLGVESLAELTPRGRQEVPRERDTGAAAGSHRLGDQDVEQPDEEGEEPDLGTPLEDSDIPPERRLGLLSGTVVVARVVLPGSLASLKALSTLIKREGRLQAPLSFAF